MKIGIDASRAFLRQRTGIEEYSYQVIKNLRGELSSHQVVLYVRKNQTVDFQLPENWKIKVINCPRLWTQLGLSWEMLLHPVDLLFVPAHTVPFIHPKNTVVTIHGLEYEFCPQAYSWFERFYMRLTIKKSCTWAKTIISVSNNTKSDLINLYRINQEKIRVIYEGYSRQEHNFQFPTCLPVGKVSNFQSNKNDQISNLNTKYLLFIGRIEERKNIANIIRAFELLKERYDIPHKLILAGKPGFGHENLKLKIQNSKFKTDVLELGFVSEDEKWELLKNAAVFIFPTLYEGFGIPILEAQSVGCPVVVANNSSIPEVTEGSALLVDAQNYEDIAESIYKLISDEALKDAIIAKGLENVKRFSWEKCSDQIAKLLNG